LQAFIENLKLVIESQQLQLLVKILG
jgi:hypothetical protein